MNAAIEMLITNTYEDGTEVVTRPTATVPLPLPEEGTEEREEWEYDHIHPHTGTGKTQGDAWYDVEIIESSAAELLGLTFEFGY
ncbi:hypothetical protein [Streptomyces sp. NPDC059874]|uniref:hypothetical protein n=1 Tax=Streptomyces sp. NPDC059874 TaxID=3346983 RepID=UPI00364E05D7